MTRTVNARRSAGRALLALLLVAALGAAGASAATAAGPGDGPGGPVLVVANPGDPFSRYYAEILRAEGLNEFDVVDLSSLTSQALAAHRVVVLAQNGLTDAQASLLTSWVQGGGDLVAMRPDAKLAGVLGITPAGGAAVENGYIKVAGTGPGAGITTDTMQFHGSADRWTASGASSVAALYSSATTATASPAVTLHAYGSGKAAAFTYDLARSVVYTRQGNPAWAGDERDHVLDDLTRSDDLFFGNSPEDPQADWVNLNKVAIPQADEQQRLLANLVTQMSADRLPLPRFWYFPRGEKAAVIMTGDDHGSASGTANRFNQYIAQSPAGCSVADWQCVRATSYLYPSSGLTNAQAQAFQAAGFEVALHLTTGCANFTPASLEQNWQDQLPEFQAKWPSAAAPVTNRTHCIAWSDWASEAIVERQHGVRLDTNYYYWPGAWVQDRPGMFTGSGIPMRFANLDGSLIDVYQATTQMTDESEINIAKHIAALLDGALGPQGYYGAFTANMHTDQYPHPGSDAIVAAAKARHVPVVSARQMLEWLDGRNGSSFGGLSYSGNQLTFSVQAAAGSRGLQAMLPVAGPSGRLSGLSRGGVPVATTSRVVKGIEYAVFDAAAGSYVATYGAAAPPAGGGGNPTPAPTPGAGTTTPAVDRKAPRVTIRPRTVRASRTGRVTLRATCPRGERRCRIDLRLRLGREYVARKTVTVAGGKTAKVTLKLRRSARRQLARKRSLKVVAYAIARDAAGNRATTKTRIRLLAPKRR
jgi:hypothetical protein